MFFQVDGQDFTDCLKIDGMAWARNDLDAAGAGRDLSGLMTRKRVANKRKLSMTMGIVSGERMKALSAALDKQYVKVTYDDPQFGRSTRTFYGSEVSATPFYEQNGVTWYKDGAFNLTER